MGKFDGILICSDWDGTLFDGNRVPEEAVSAIKYFQENGGKFTLCSGRPPFYIKELFKYVTPNTYCLALNGTVICDIESGEILRDMLVDDKIFDIVKQLLCMGVEISRVSACVKGLNSYLHFAPDEFLKSIETLKGEEIYKITLTTAVESDGDLLAERAKKIKSDKYSIVRSGRGYAEVILSECAKGPAALYLKRLIGARLLVCMGDYENDISMFKCADVSYAPENAIPAIKELATHITANVRDAAVAHVIEDIEKRYL